MRTSHTVKTFIGVSSASVQRISEIRQKDNKSLTEGGKNRSDDKNSGKTTENKTLCKISKIVLASKIAFPFIFVVFNVVYHFVYV